MRLRLARSSDLPLIRALLERHHPASPELLASRLAHFDPRREWVLCASGLLDGRETLFGVGAVRLTPPGSEPHLVVTGEHAGEEVGRLLREALRNAARVLERTRAA